jgi:hypothetical protein
VAACITFPLHGKASSDPFTRLNEVLTGCPAFSSLLFFLNGMQYAFHSIQFNVINENKHCTSSAETTLIRNDDILIKMERKHKNQLFLPAA